jgi:GTP-binding protein HflX
MEHDGTIDPAWPARTIEVLNKADLLGGVDQVQPREGGVPISAITGDGLPALLAAIDARMAAGMEQADYDIPPGDGARLAWLYEHGEVLERADGEDTIHLTVRLLPADRARFEQSRQT